METEKVTLMLTKNEAWDICSYLEKALSEPFLSHWHEIFENARQAIQGDS